MSTADQLKALADWCANQVGRPVMWSSKGDHYFTDDGSRVTLPTGTLVFDCSGLVTCGVKVCGGPDLRDTHNAQRIANEAPEVEVGNPDPGMLGFYGTSWDTVNHIVIAIEGGHLVSADGATHTIRNLADAKAAGAIVRVHDRFNYRRDEPFLGWRPNVLFNS